MASCAENAIRCAQLSPITAKLTLRQVEVFELILKGYCNKEIAANLNIELRTVKLLIERVYRTLGVTNRWELLRKFGRFEVTVTWIPHNLKNNT